MSLSLLKRIRLPEHQCFWLSPPRIGLPSLSSYGWIKRTPFSSPTTINAAPINWVRFRIWLEFFRKCMWDTFGIQCSFSSIMRVTRGDSKRNSATPNAFNPISCSWSYCLILAKTTRRWDQQLNKASYRHDNQQPFFGSWCYSISYKPVFRCSSRQC